MVSGDKRKATLAVVVAALGYFVDIYDLILFGMVRKDSLLGIGITAPKALTDEGLFLLNMQMGGMLIGGILWGVLGDKRGRLSVLFGSITLYSLANIANGLVDSVGTYAACRLIAGIGLAGELGAGITLVSELMHRHTRGLGTTVVAAFGLSGGVVAGLVGGAIPGIGVDWRTAYFIGGGMGLALLVLRIGVVESGLFAATAANKAVSRGDFFALFSDPRRLGRYLAIIAIGVPVWYVIGILFTLSPELGTALGLPEPPRPQTALFLAYAGLTVGDVASGYVSHRLKSRRATLGLFLAATAAAVIAFFALGGTSLTVFYVLCAIGGVAIGYWAVFVSTAAELFGTNLRATVATTVPNFVRGSVVLLTLGFTTFKGSLGPLGAAMVVGVFSLGVAFAGLAALRETFAVDLDFHEDAPGPAAGGATSGT
ncbi:MAG TPA: MFS transporter [Kofleriaceae bacterium]|nr:MFS transporter [Kofleriaceae bacterium]